MIISRNVNYRVIRIGIKQEFILDAFNAQQESSSKPYSISKVSLPKSSFSVCLYTTPSSRIHDSTCTKSATNEGILHFNIPALPLITYSVSISASYFWLTTTSGGKERMLKGKITKIEEWKLIKKHYRYDIIPHTCVYSFLVVSVYGYFYIEIDERTKHRFQNETATKTFLIDFNVGQGADNLKRVFMTFRQHYDCWRIS